MKGAPLSPHSPRSLLYLVLGGLGKEVEELDVKVAEDSIWRGGHEVVQLGRAGRCVMRSRVFPPGPLSCPSSLKLAHSVAPAPPLSPRPAGNWQEDRTKAPPLHGGIADYGFVSATPRNSQRPHLDFQRILPLSQMIFRRARVHEDRKRCACATFGWISIIDTMRLLCISLAHSRYPAKPSTRLSSSPPLTLLPPSPVFLCSASTRLSTRTTFPPRTTPSAPQPWPSTGPGSAW